jgi:predicted molibdopterin-dependent oxidoreductase YjgC
LSLKAKFKIENIFFLSSLKKSNFIFLFLKKLKTYIENENTDNTERTPDFYPALQGLGTT